MLNDLNTALVIAQTYKKNFQIPNIVSNKFTDSYENDTYPEFKFDRI